MRLKNIFRLFPYLLIVSLFFTEKGFALSPASIVQNQIIYDLLVQKQIESTLWLKRKLLQYGFNPDLVDENISFATAPKGEMYGITPFGNTVTIADNFSTLTIVADQITTYTDNRNSSTKGRVYFSNSDAILFHEFFHDYYFSPNISREQREHFKKLLLGNKEVQKFLISLYGSGKVMNLYLQWSNNSNSAYTEKTFSEYFARLVALYWQIYIKNLLYNAQPVLEEEIAFDELYFFEGNATELPKRLIEFFEQLKLKSNHLSPLLFSKMVPNTFETSL